MTENDWWCRWAKTRGLVRLDDGRIGSLVHWGWRTGMAKVLVANRHERVPFASIIEPVT